jgi:hypothetical protein
VRAAFGNIELREVFRGQVRRGPLTERWRPSSDIDGDIPDLSEAANAGPARYDARSLIDCPARTPCEFPRPGTSPREKSQGNIRERRDGRLVR